MRSCPPLFAIITACAPVYHAQRTPTLPHDLLAQRSRLPHADTADPAQLRDLIELARSLGNNRRGAGTRPPPAQPRAHAGGTGAASGAPQDTEDTWRDLRRYLLETAQRSRRAAARARHPEPPTCRGRDLEVFAWAVDRVDYIPDPDIYRAALTRAGSDVEARGRSRAQEALRRDGRRSRAERGQSRSEPADKTCSSVGSTTPPRATSSPKSGAPRRRWSTSTRGHLGARVALIVRDEIERAFSRGRPDLLAESSRRYRSLTHGQMAPLARLLRDHEAQPLAVGPRWPSPTAQRAPVSWEIAVAARATIGERVDVARDARAVAEAMAALAALAGGDDATYREWADDADADDSPFITRSCSSSSRRRARDGNGPGRRGPPPGSRARRQRGMVGGAHAHVGRSTASLCIAVSLCPEPMPRSSFQFAPGLCVDRALDADACRALIDAAFALEDPGRHRATSAVGLEELVPWSDFPERWLWAAGSPRSCDPPGAAQDTGGDRRYGRVHHRALRRHTRPHGAGVGGCGRRHQRAGGVPQLTVPAWRVAARLAIGALKDGESDGAGAFDAFSAPPSFADSPHLAASSVGATRRQQIHDSHPGTGRQPRFNRGLALFREGAMVEAAAELAPLEAFLSGDEALELIAYRAIAPTWRVTMTRHRDSSTACWSWTRVPSPPILSPAGSPPGGATPGQPSRSSA